MGSTILRLSGRQGEQVEGGEASKGGISKPGEARQCLLLPPGPCENRMFVKTKILYIGESDIFGIAPTLLTKSTALKYSRIDVLGGKVI